MQTVKDTGGHTRRCVPLKSYEVGFFVFQILATNQFKEPNKQTKPGYHSYKRKRGHDETFLS